ncbi:MAG: helix-turn-helix domain-containing protein [Bacteroidia bacterium]|nr:helix-turn-helix domain-containing protein [Bacteroidia bacterium]MBT8276684.1 helix-turn-helix domain-containing protein [Bacteroidia bacterium]NNF32221.1 helix-turn-helix domain-containing protein [Flavobacteriaceae bacterium]NNK55142.1 helix-turn-helix domain-containing protein [Flavobacteriaceae bacterium]NNM08456.1 helix-turn-helix domain-containing protein [Flavobacteriaceae bacterium]
METKDILLVVLLAIGAIQGIIYGGILWRTRTLHKTAKQFLATILFFFSYRLIAEILHSFGLGRYDTWYYILLEYNWIYGALIYFFVLSYVTPTFKLKTKHWIHFLPVLIEIIWSFFIKAQNFYWDGTRESLSWLGYWGYVVWMRYPTMYIIAGGLIVYYSFKAEKILNYPPVIPGYRIIKENTKWIKRVVIALRIFSILFTAIVLIDFLFFDYSYSFFGDPIFVIMAVITYWLGLEGFARRNTLAFKKVEILSEKDQFQLEEIANKISNVMTEKKLYKNQELTLAGLSEAIDVKSYLVTKALTSIFNKKFNDYINELRFNELKSLIKDPKNDKFTLLSLAFEAGFNSKASFNRTVKKITGNSPKYLKSEAY